MVSILAIVPLPQERDYIRVNRISLATRTSTLLVSLQKSARPYPVNAVACRDLPALSLLVKRGAEELTLRLAWH